MSGLALTARFDGGPPVLEQLRLMTAAGAHRGAAGTLEGRGAAATFLDGREEHAMGSMPRSSPDGTVLLVADARLDNRGEIAAELGCPSAPEPQDAGALLLEAYARWGAAFADRLIGDFAIAIWDARTQRLLLARDVMGLRPLVYRVGERRILVASEVKQLLAAPGVPRNPSRRMIISSLAGTPPLPGWTFYEQIRRVPPGVTLVIDGSGARVRRHWSPPSRARPQDLSAHDYAAALRDALGDAVRWRMQAALAPGLLLSGGLDSASIAGLAGALFREGEAVPPLATFSFAYDELAELDERSVSGAVVARFGLPSSAVGADALWPLARHPEHGPDLDAPDRLRSHVQFDTAIELARRQGVTTLMTGQRGDAMIGGDVVDYLGRLREAGPIAAWRDLRRHSAESGRPRLALLRRHVLGRLPALVWPGWRTSRWARRARALVSSEGGASPTWVRDEAMAALDLDEVAHRAAIDSRLRPEARRRRHLEILDDRIARNAEAIERRTAAAGVRYVDPWADRRLAELMLEVPQHLVTPAGESKALLREAMRGVLPEGARLSARKSTPGPLYDRGLLDRAEPVVRSLIEGSRLARMGLVNEDSLRLAYQRLQARDPAAIERGDAALFWRFVDVEDWVRRYHD